MIPGVINLIRADDDLPTAESLTLVADGSRAWAGTRMSIDNVVAYRVTVESLDGVNMRERWAGTRPTGSRPVVSN